MNNCLEVESLSIDFEYLERGGIVLGGSSFVGEGLYLIV